MPLKQGGFFPELLTEKKTFPLEEGKTFPQITLKNLLSERFIEDNGMFGLRMLLKKAKKNGQHEQYLRILNAEISMKRGENTIKNNLRHVLLHEIIKT